MEFIKKYYKRWVIPSVVTAIFSLIYPIMQTISYEEYILWQVEKIYSGNPQNVIGIRMVYVSVLPIVAYLFWEFWRHAILVLMDLSSKKLVTETVFVNDRPSLEARYDKQKDKGLPIGYYEVKGLCNNGKVKKFYVDTDVYRLGSGTAHTMKLTYYKHSKIVTDVEILDSQPRKYKKSYIHKKYGASKDFAINSFLGGAKIIAVFLISALITSKVITFTAPVIANVNYNCNPTKENLYFLCLSLAPSIRFEDANKYYELFVCRDGLYETIDELTEFDAEDVSNMFIAEYIQSSYKTKTFDEFSKDVSKVIKINDGIYLDKEGYHWRYLKERMIIADNDEMALDFLGALHVALNSDNISKSKKIDGYIFLLEEYSSIGDMESYNKVMSDYRSIRGRLETTEKVK